MNSHSWHGMVASGSYYVLTTGLPWLYLLDLLEGLLGDILVCLRLSRRLEDEAKSNRDFLGVRVGEAKLSGMD